MLQRMQRAWSRAEAEAIYDAGREVCVQVHKNIAARVQQLEERLSVWRLQRVRTPVPVPGRRRWIRRRAGAAAGGGARRAKELMRREGEQRKAGGQPGHRGTGRVLRPEDQIDEIVDHFPDGVVGAVVSSPPAAASEAAVRSPPGRGVAADQRDVDRAPHASVAVSALSRTAGAPLPPRIGVWVGAAVQAALVTLTARHRVSRRGICELARDLFGITLSTGAVDAICQRA